MPMSRVHPLQIELQQEFDKSSSIEGLHFNSVAERKMRERKRGQFWIECPSLLIEPREGFGGNQSVGIVGSLRRIEGNELPAAMGKAIV